MAITSTRDISAQMITQLRLLDPSASAEVGTPERKIIDTVAQALYDSSIDLAALQQGLDIDSKYGAALDRFLAIFGFARQKPTYATGFVTFSRASAANVDVRIPGGSTVQAVADSTAMDSALANVPFATLFDSAIPAGQTSVTVPIQCTIAGTIGNVAAESITRVVGSTLFGVSAVVNDQPTSGGLDVESDDEFKLRFKNTVFRNLAGTEDQFLALAVATAFTSKANVVGPVSTYQEYIQVPPVDDATAYDMTGGSSPIAGGGNAGEYTSAMSTLPYAKYIYAAEQPAFITNGQYGAGTIFYRQDTDFSFNGIAATVGNAIDFTRFRGDTFRAQFYGLDVTPTASIIRPNVTFRNVYTGGTATIQAVRPGDVVLLEYSYLSSASRADVTLGIYNTVDVYIDGGNITSADTVLSKPSSASQFVDNSTSKFHYEYYRRVGQPEKRPLLGNVFQPLYWQPVTDVPDQIVVGTNTYNKGEHYWAVEDISNVGGTVRARAGIEWHTGLKGRLTTDGAVPSSYSGQVITANTPDATDYFEVSGYSYDKNVLDLQAALTGAKQVTTDVLAHRARTRYFKLDITVMYTQGYAIADTNQQIHDAVDTYLRSQYFGSTIQLSDLLQIIHAVPGVDNVRWTADTSSVSGAIRIYETDSQGIPLLGVTTDRIQWGTTTTPGIQGLYVQGQPTSGNYALSVPSTPGTVGGPRVLTASLTYNTGATALATAINAINGNAVTVTEDTRTNVGARVPLRSFRIQFTTNGARDLILPSNINSSGAAVALSKSAYGITADFFLRDDELAALPTDSYVPTNGVPDTVPGLIIRPRAQNTWTRTV